MIRLLYEDEPGWKSVRRIRQDGRMQDVINSNIEALLPMCLKYTMSAQVHLYKKETKFTLHFIKGRAEDSISQGVELCERRWDVWTSGNKCLWKMSHNDCVCLLYSHNAADEPQMELARLHTTTHLTRAESDDVWKKRQSLGAYHGFFVEIIWRVNVKQNALRAIFVSDKCLKDVRGFEAPVCVNACYTGIIRGAVRENHGIVTINSKNERGPCGSEFYISTVLGVLHIFSTTHGMRRVTCKAFTNITEAEFALAFTCVQMGVTPVDGLKVHMIIMKGTIGGHVDIASGGNVEGLLKTHFSDSVKYIPRLDEVNVHATCKWQNLWKMQASCPPDVQAVMEPHRGILQRTELNMSITRLGTCIYNVSVKKQPPRSEVSRKRSASPTASEGDEMCSRKSKQIEKCFFAICTYVHDMLSMHA